MEYISYCGIKCKECPIYIATAKSDDAMRIQLAKDYSTDKCSFTKEDMNCQGCHSDMVKDSKMCGPCEIRKCADNKDIATCGECTGYPCVLIYKYVSDECESRKILDEISIISKKHKVNIKPVSKEDIKFIYELSNNEEIMRIFHDKPTTLNQWQNFIEEWEKDADEQNYIITRVCDGVDVGWLGINGLSSEDKIGWIKGIAIAPEYWGYGYGSQAIEKVKEIFKVKGFRNIKLWTDACNERARKCYEASGFCVQEIRLKKVGNLEKGVDRVLMSCML